MTLKQKLFIANYTNIHNPKTFSNGTQSALKAYNSSTSPTAAVTASRLLKNDNVISEVDRILEEIGMDSKVRLKSIADIIKGDHLQTTTSTTKKGRKILYKTTTVKSPPASDVIRAVNLLSKIDGTYDKNRAKADVVSAAMLDVFKRHRQELSQGSGGGGKPPTG